MKTNDIVSLVINDFVRFGSDFDRIPSLSNGVTGCDVYIELINQLQKRYKQETTVEKIAYKNVLRVLKDNE